MNIEEKRNSMLLATVAKHGLKKQATLTETASTIVISTDTAGIALNLTEAILTIYIPAMVANNLVKVNFNDITSSNYYDATAGTGAAIFVTCGKAGTVHGFMDMRLHLIGGNVTSQSFNHYANTTPAVISATDIGILKLGNITGITSITLWVAGGESFPIGTTYKLYGETV